MAESVKNGLKFKDLNRANLNFEKKSFYVLFTPLFLLIAIYVFLKKKIISHPKTNSYFFDGKSRLCREIKKNATGWKALDIIYNYRSKNDDMFTDFWLNIRNAQAVRNRLKAIKYLLLKNIEDISKEGKEVRLISIASGSAQGVIETVAEAKKKGIAVKAVLIDLDQTAIEYSKKIAQEMKIEDQFIFINKAASFVNEMGRKFKPNLIEMVGFLEYRPLDKSLKLINSICQALKSEGVFLTSQIASNSESFFLREVINWSMIYRRPKEIADILSSSGFPLKNCSFYWEPLKFHYIAECKKI